MVNTPGPLEERSRELFDESVERVDARTRSRLNQARQRALAEMNKGRRYWLAAPLGGLVAAALIAVILIRTGGEAPTPANAGGLLDDMDIVADAVNFELIQDVEFYSWLAENDAGAG